jgi:hypothetical protein
MDNSEDFMVITTLETMTFKKGLRLKKPIAKRIETKPPRFERSSNL